MAFEENAFGHQNTDLFTLPSTLDLTNGRRREEKRIEKGFQLIDQQSKSTAKTWRSGVGRLATTSHHSKKCCKAERAFLEQSVRTKVVTDVGSLSRDCHVTLCSRTSTLPQGWRYLSHHKKTCLGHDLQL
jgi:hypothetical protein